MNYKNFVFDFGNVLASFDGEELLTHFCEDKKDRALLKKIIFENWQALDEGTIRYQDYIDQALLQTPEHLHKNVRAFFKDWHRYLAPLTQTWDFIRELKASGHSIYLLSNAPVYFADHASEVYEILKEFDGILFSAPVLLAKPQPEIYRLLFDKWDLDPQDCFFLDDKPENIEAAKKAGMNGIVFTGDIEAVKAAAFS